MQAPSTGAGATATATKVCIQYGCGLSAPDGWVNYDASPTLRAQKLPVIGPFMPGVKFPRAVRYGDVLKGLPHREGSVDCAYCSHVLEHLSRQDCRAAIAETFRVLKPGGVFRLVLPNLEALCRRYIDAAGSPEAVHEFMKKSHLGYDTRPRGITAVLKSLLANHMHLWMWDEAALAVELRDAGFIGVRRAEIGDSGEPAYAAVEDENRWEGHLGFHAVKPGGDEQHSNTGAES